VFYCNLYVETREIPCLTPQEVAMVKTVKRYARYALSTLSTAMFIHAS
jgi:hypothetical protein